MAERKIKPVADNYDKCNTYRKNMGRYKLAMKHKFYFEAMMICYSIMEDRLNSWLYYLGCRNTTSSYKFDCKNCKDKLRPMVEKYMPKESKNLAITSISGKRKIVKATLLWAKDGYPGADEDKYYSSVWEVYQTLDIDEVLSCLERCEEWCAYRNEIVHALMNKNTDSLNSELEKRADEGMNIARCFDDYAKSVKKGNAIRRSISLKSL